MIREHSHDYIRVVSLFQAFCTDPPNDENVTFNESDWQVYDEAVANVAKARSAL